MCNWLWNSERVNPSGLWSRSQWDSVSSVCSFPFRSEMEINFNGIYTFLLRITDLHTLDMYLVRGRWTSTDESKSRRVECRCWFRLSWSRAYGRTRAREWKNRLEKHKLRATTSGAISNFNFTGRCRQGSGRYINRIRVFGRTRSRDETSRPEEFRCCPWNCGKPLLTRIGSRR